MDFVAYQSNKDSFFHLAEICNLKNEFEEISLSISTFPSKRQSLTVENANWVLKMGESFFSSHKNYKKLIKICKEYLSYKKEK